MKNCPLEFAISFKTLRAAAGVALKVRSTMLRFNNAGDGVAVFVAAALRPAAGDGVGVDEAACSSGNGARRKEVTLSTFASSRMFISIWIWESSCPRSGAAAVSGNAMANSSKPS